MKRQSLLAATVVVALCAVLGACSGGSDDQPEASASPSKTAPTATAAPSTPAPVAATQPPGANGVTYRIQDWERYQSDEAVVEWTHISEGLAASINQRTIVSGLEKRTSKKVLRTFVNAVNISKQRDYHVADLGDVKVLSSKTDGDRAELTMCMWSTTTGIRDKNDKAVGDDENIWFKQDAVLSKASGQWILKSIDDNGTCEGGAPS